MAMFHASSMLIDCFGNEYSICRMPGSGFCGFHALSLSLSGTQFSHSDIIDDCISMFTNIPDLFRLRTNFGGRNDSCVTVGEYASFMQDAVRQVQTGRSVDSDAWCEDGHLAAISLLYDVIVFTYSIVNKQWYVFNESGTRGYICLLSLPGHFDVLCGVNGPPVLPIGAHTHCVTREAFRLSDDVWQFLQRNYSLRFVFKLPDGFTGINILNHPVASVKAAVNPAAVGRDRDASEQKNKALHKCDVTGCNYESSNMKSVVMHKVKCHRYRTSNNAASLRGRNKTVDGSAVQTGIKAVHECDFPDCNYTNDNARVMCMHKVRCHKWTKSLNTAAAMKCTTNSRKESVVSQETTGVDVEPDSSAHSCTSSACPEAESDVSSVRSLESTASRRSKRIAARPPAKKGGYRCDVLNCGALFDTQRGLSLHKRSHPCARMHADETTSIQSTVTVDSSCVRRSARICNLKRPCTVRNQTEGLQVKQSKVHGHTAAHSSLEGNTDRAETVRGNSNVLSQATKKKVCADTCSRTHYALSDKTTKQNIKHSLAEEITALENEIQPRETTSIQSDSASAVSVDSSCVQRSARIYNLRRTCTVRNQTEGTQAKQSKVHRHTAAQSLLEGNTDRAETVRGNSNVLSQATKKICADTCTRRHYALLDKTTKQLVKRSFAEEIAALENEIQPREKRQQQHDPLYEKLKNYHDNILKTLTNTTTEKLSAEVLQVILDPSVIDTSDRQFTWSEEDESRLNELNRTCKSLQARYDWKWGAAPDSEQGRYNDARMQFCITKECKWRLIECPNCESTGLLVGEQTESTVCYDCLQLQRFREKERNKRQEAWEKVKPKTKEFPKTADGQDLPYLQPGDKAVIAPIHPVVTVKKNHYADKKLRQESISLVQDPVPTWCKVLPRTSLSDRFMVIERRVRDCKKYIIANADRVRQWLRYLFLHHEDFIRLQRLNELQIDESAIEALTPNLELAEVDCARAEHSASEAEQIEKEIQRNDEGLTDATVESGLSETHVFSFDRYPELYLKSKDVLRIRKEGKMEIIEDDTVRKPTYCTSANLAFPHLYPHGEMSPLDFQDYKLGRYLLKKQSLYAYEKSDGKLEFTYAEDDIHMAHQYARLSEQTVRANVGYYLSSHPSVAHVPIKNVIEAFRHGVDHDTGLLDSHLPDLTTIMSQLPSSRQRWFSERLSIEAISRDLGSPNLFVTINLDPRASPDVRSLIYKLEHGKDMERDEPFLKDTAEFTRLLSKHAPHVSVYLYRKVKIMMRVFFTKICGIPEMEPVCDWTQRDQTENSWWWGRVEFTETRGVQHWHFLAKLGNVLDTGVLGRIVHNGRLVRQELKCGNIKPEKREEAWQMIEMSLLASRYAALFAHSISTASFYSEDVGVDGHDDDKVIQLEDYRKEFARSYKDGNINLNTHPVMRRFDDPECDPNVHTEMARVASVSCLHQCIRGSCGGDPMTGDGCRFDFPKKTLKHTVAAVMQVNAKQMETRILMRRTCDRVANLNRYLLRYLRSNHDVSVLIDSAHKLRYATKYCAKSGKHTELLNSMIEELSKRSTNSLPPNMKQVLSHLLLADCSHRAFMSKPELAYKVMNLPDVSKSFANVDIVGFYQRSNLQVPYDNEYTIEYSDRTEYSAYAERCRDNTELGRGLTKEAIEDMCFNEFAETVQHRWINEKPAEPTVIDETTKRKFRTRDVKSGHWRLTRCRRRKHIRPSTVLHTAPAIDYEFVEHGKTTTQTTFFDLPIDKRHQLYRSYYELVMYVPWRNTPDETFLSPEARKSLKTSITHSEIDSRHSLQRLEEFFKVYQQLYNDGRVAPPGSSWQRDNQFSYSMFLVNQHNKEIHLDRVDNRGVLKAQFEDVDELVNVDVDIRAAVNDVTDLSEYPTFENFMPPETFRNIVEQPPMKMSEMCVAFPLQHQWQHLEEMATHDKAKRFIACPPPSPVDYKDMSPIQQFAVDVGKDEQHQILFLCGKAGSGKTAVALKICEHFRGRVQATAYTGKAASLFNGPTIHSMFGWSHHQDRSMSSAITPDSNKVRDFRVAHEGVELFVIEEALAIPPAYFALMDEMMTAAFNAKHKTNTKQKLPPYGGKKMLFLGDQAQLPPIGGPAVYDDSSATSDSMNVTRKRETKLSTRSKTGQLIFEKYLVPNCIYLQRSQRNTGLLGQICDRMRNGELTDNDCTMLTYQRSRFPDVCTDYGIHYQNDMCSMYNWRQLANECIISTPKRRIFLCKATYHVTADNEQIVDALSVLPPQAYHYAPDILCIAEGCEVRLLQNVNVAAGLVTSQSGTVVKVIYNNADVQALLAGKPVVPYCIIVAFPAFQGFLEKNSASTRIFPFPNQRSWVPIYRKRFNVKISYLLRWVRKRQLESLCYRIQFPLDLASNITAHRAQGQTMADCLVSVDLGLENPDTSLSPEMSSLLYVACTRVTRLENLFVSAIHPCVWQKIGQSDVDKRRRVVDEHLRKAAQEFAMHHGKYAETVQELAWTADCSNNDAERRKLHAQTESPKKRDDSSLLQSATDADFDVCLDDSNFRMFSKPVVAERHIGIDQGEKNFAIVVVERTVGNNPHIVAANNYTDLELNKRFKAVDVLVALTDKTDLLSWMKPAYDHYQVDRVIVHLEQIDPRNRNSKQFSVALGKLLQQQASDVETCVVKMSQPHIHRATGPMFHLGHEIVETLQLKPALYQQTRTRAESNPAIVAVQHDDNECGLSDVEPSDASPAAASRQAQSTEYRRKKTMSSNVFRYIMDANDEQLQQMKLAVDSRVQQYWQAKLMSDASVKLDDVGDALLHALDELLCGSTNFKQLVPAAPSVHLNRTVTVVVFPDTTYWIVLSCRWNTFVLENLGCFSSHLRNHYYKDPSTVEALKRNIADCVELWAALSDFEGSPSSYDAVDHIRVVIKQLTGHTGLALTNKEAGALTESTTKAMKSICDSVMGVNSKLFQRQDRVLGSVYSRTSAFHRDRKFQVVNSTGKHTNAVVSCLSWMKENLRDFVEKRREFLNEHEKNKFFCAILDTAHSSGNSVGMLQLSDTVMTKLCSHEVARLMQIDNTFGRNIADIILVAMSKNQQNVKAIAANSRKRPASPIPQAHEHDVEL